VIIARLRASIATINGMHDPPEGLLKSLLYERQGWITFAASLVVEDVVELGALKERFRLVEISKDDQSVNPFKVSATAWATLVRSISQTAPGKVAR
jgi:hypothetical protein